MPYGHGWSYAAEMGGILALHSKHCRHEPTAAAAYYDAQHILIAWPGVAT
jgi:hypothetical protein